MPSRHRRGAKRFEIRLDPPELGRVEVRIEVTREGHATMHLVVERSETLDMLQRDTRLLERALQNAGLNTSDGDLILSLRIRDTPIITPGTISRHNSGQSICHPLKRTGSHCRAGM